MRAVVAARQDRRGHAQRPQQALLDQLVDGRAVGTLERELQHDEARMGIKMLLAGTLLCLPGVERADEFGQRVASVRPRRMILRQQQARRVGGELTERDAADVAALLQLRDVFCRGVLEPELAFVHRLRQQRGLEHLAQRCEIEQRIGHDAPLLGAIGPPVIEERDPALEAQRHGDAAGAVGRHDRLHLSRDDALGVPVGAGGGTAE